MHWRLTRTLTAVILVVIAAGSLPGVLPVEADFDPIFTKTGALARGALGLPGEQITWTITVTNDSDTPSPPLTVTDDVPAALRIERASTDRGAFTLNGQTVTFTLDALAPGGVATMQIVTTILDSPADGRITNSARLTSTDDITWTSNAEVDVVAMLPATGYAPDESAPSAAPPWPLLMAGLAAFALTTVFVLALFWRYAPR
jgi:uncharacterized repeat protein (TIGR01451 family)